jgi:hypothetical protein
VAMRVHIDPQNGLRNMPCGLQDARMTDCKACDGPCPGG